MQSRMWRNDQRSVRFPELIAMSYPAITRRTVCTKVSGTPHGAGRQLGERLGPSQVRFSSAFHSEANSRGAK